MQLLDGARKPLEARTEAKGTIYKHAYQKEDKGAQKGFNLSSEEA